jgi:hypothetical protein
MRRNSSVIGMWIAGTLLATTLTQANVKDGMFSDDAIQAAVIENMDPHELEIDPPNSDDYRLDAATIKGTFSDGGYVRDRIIVSVIKDTGPVYLRYHGLHENTGVNRTDYDALHRNALIAGPNNWGVYSSFVIKMDQDGVFDRKFGIRDHNLINTVCDAGFIEFGFDDDSTNVTIVCDRNIGPYTLTGVHSNERREDVAHYGEIEASGNFGEFGAYARIEVGTGFRPRYIGGIRFFGSSK